MQDQLIHDVSLGQSPLLLQGIPPLELLDDEEDDEDEDEDDDEDADAPPPPAVPLDELELFSAPPLPPVAGPGSN